MKINNLPHFRDESMKGKKLGAIRAGSTIRAFALCSSSLGKSGRSRTRRSWRSRKVPLKSRAPDTSMAMNASPAKEPLTPRLAVPPLPGEREGNQSPSPLTGEWAPAGGGRVRVPFEAHWTLTAPRGINRINSLCAR
jgi:hypothetical protein